MGKLSQGIFGGFRNKVGNLVGSSWKGIAVVKTKPLSVANPRTAGQVAQRTKMTNVTVIASVLLPSIIVALWNRFAVKMSGYNLFVKTNIEFLDTVDVASMRNISLSKGKLSPASAFTMSADDSDSNIILNVTQGTLNQFSAMTDICVFAIYNVSQDYWLTQLNIGDRFDTVYNIGDNRMIGGDELVGYIMYRRSDGTYVSDSVSADCVVAA